MSQPVNDHFKPEIQPDWPVNCAISALFRTLKSSKSLKSYTVNENTFTVNGK